MIKRIIYIAIFILLNNFLYSEEFNIRKIERIAESSNEGKEASDIISIIDYFYKNPISLYNTDAKHLSLLPTINLNAAMRILSFIAKNPNSTYDDIFTTIKLSEEQSYILQLCTKLSYENKSNPINENYVNLRIKTENPLQENKGIETGKYLGTNYSFTNKLNFSIDNYKFGFGSDKDIGESRFIDFYNFYLSKEYREFSVYIGNYKVSSGLGNILSSAFNQPKMNILINSENDLKNSILPDNSSSGLKSFRGIALNYSAVRSENAQLNLSAFYSNNSKAATIDELGYVSSVYTSDYFRTQNEIDKKDLLKENSIGVIADLQMKAIELGISALSINYNREIKSSSSSAVIGKSTFLYSLFGSYTYDSLTINGELSFNDIGENAACGFLKYYSNASEINLNYRYFSDFFRSPYGNNPGENSSPANEMGMNFGYLYKGIKNTRIAFMLDYFETLKRTYTVYQPVKGFESEIRMDHKLNNNNALFFKFRYQNKDNQKTDDDNIKTIFKDEIYTFRTDYSRQWNKKLNQTLRFDLNYIPENKVESSKYGFLISAANDYDLLENLRLSFDIAYYNSDDYYSGVWLFNYFAPGSSQINALYDEGYRANLILRYEPINNLNIYFGYRINHKLNKSSIGSGYDEIYSNSDQRFLLQIEWGIKW